MRGIQSGYLSLCLSVYLMAPNDTIRLASNASMLQCNNALVLIVPMLQASEESHSLRPTKRIAILKYVILGIDNVDNIDNINYA